MRKDMSKVIVERPRGGFGKGSRKGTMRFLQRVPIDELPLRERKCTKKTKCLNENLAPLRRFLEKNVNRPWNNVFSEICENLRCDSAVQKHVRDHLWDFVALHVERIDGRIRYKARSSGPWVRHGIHHRYYVDPETGYLRASPPYWRGISKKRKRGHDAPAQRLHLDTFRQLRWMDGDWYELELSPLRERGVAAWDVVLSKPVARLGEHQLKRTHGSLVYASKKRRVSPAELRAYRNEYRKSFA